MSYCPEHGNEMVVQGQDLAGSIWYRCPNGDLWFYDADTGHYGILEDMEVCPACGFTKGTTCICMPIEEYQF